MATKRGRGGGSFIYFDFFTPFFWEKSSTNATRMEMISRTTFVAILCNSFFFSCHKIALYTASREVISRNGTSSISNYTRTPKGPVDVAYKSKERGNKHRGGQTQDLTQIYGFLLVSCARQTKECVYVAFFHVQCYFLLLQTYLNSLSTVVLYCNQN